MFCLKLVKDVTFVVNFLLGFLYRVVWIPRGIINYCSWGRRSGFATLPCTMYLRYAGDLFPGQNPPRKVDEELEHFVVKACEVTGNHPDDLFCLKVCALFYGSASQQRVSTRKPKLYILVGCSPPVSSMIAIKSKLFPNVCMWVEYCTATVLDALLFVHQPNGAGTCVDNDVTNR